MRPAWEPGEGQHLGLGCVHYSVGGPDVWELIRDLQRWPGEGMQRVERMIAAQCLADDDPCVVVVLMRKANHP